MEMSPVVSDALPTSTEPTAQISFFEFEQKVRQSHGPLIVALTVNFCPFMYVPVLLYFCIVVFFCAIVCLKYSCQFVALKLHDGSKQLSRYTSKAVFRIEQARCTIWIMCALSIRKGGPVSTDGTCVCSQ